MALDRHSERSDESPREALLSAQLVRERLGAPTRHRCSPHSSWLSFRVQRKITARSRCGQPHREALSLVTPSSVHRDRVGRHSARNEESPREALSAVNPTISFSPNQFRARSFQRRSDSSINDIFFARDFPLSDGSNEIASSIRAKTTSKLRKPEKSRHVVVFRGAIVDMRLVCHIRRSKSLVTPVWIVFGGLPECRDSPAS